MTDEDWTKAESHLKKVIEQYKSLIGIPGVNVTFALSYLSRTLNDYHSGNRSQELYEEMLDAQ